MIKTITSYQTEDGQIFPTMEDAQWHNEVVPLAKKIDEMRLAGVTMYEVADWILRHFDRKPSAKPGITYDDGLGNIHKIEDGKVWFLRRGTWLTCKIMVDYAERLVREGKWREVPAK